MAAVTFDVPFVLGMMRLHEAQEMHQASHLADWIEARLEQGLHWFDHADIYGNGACETLFGQALRARPALAKRLHVVTKASIANDNPAPGSGKVKHYNASPDYLGRAIDDALGRLGVERLDHFLIHRPDLLMDAAATGRALDDAIEAGKIGAAGTTIYPASGAGCNAICTTRYAPTKSSFPLPIARRCSTAASTT